MLTIDGDAPIRLGAVIAKAGEGTVYQVADRPEWVAKIFHPTLKQLPEKLDKVSAMVRSTPPGAVQSDGFVVLSWPLRVVHSEGRPVGYVMARIDTTAAVEIHAVSNPSSRADPLPGQPIWTAHATWGHLVSIAANLCLAVAAVHRVNAVVGDFQERNILVHDSTRVSLVDCDSMQFIDGRGRRFLCGIGRPEFTAPELAAVDLRVTPRRPASDLFALAVHVHLLLMGGNHPFQRGTWTGIGEQPDALTLSRSGDWAGGPSSRLARHPLAPSVGFLPDEICRLFARAFTTGARDPVQRPGAAEWRDALLRLTTAPCARGTHQIPTSARVCPWCAIDDERAARRQRRHVLASVAATAGPSQEQVIHPVVVPGSPQPAPGKRASAQARFLQYSVGIAGGALVVLAVGALLLWGVRPSAPDSGGPGPVTIYPGAPPPIVPDWPTVDVTSAPNPVTITEVPADSTEPFFLTYTVSGTKAPNDRISVTYTDAKGEQRTRQNVYIPWSLTVTPVSRSAIGSVRASSLLQTSMLRCSITTSEGAVVASSADDSSTTVC